MVARVACDLSAQTLVWVTEGYALYDLVEVLTMKAEAWGQNRHEKDHLLTPEEGVDFSLNPLTDDGSVSVTFKTNRPFDISGDYYVRLIFTAAEMDKMHRQSLASTTKGLIQPPAPKSVENIVRRI